MAIEALSRRSGIPSAAAQYGYANHPVPHKRVIYNGQSLPRFLKDNGIDPSRYREVLILSRIGSAFDELQPGRELILPTR